MTALNRTIADVRRRAKLQNRIALKVQQTLAAMLRGEALHYHHGRFGAIWWLSRSGRHIPDEVARLVITHPVVVGVGDALPLGNDTPAQTYRYAK
jgi:hypothetical protein